MSKRHPNPRLAKIHRNYTVEEIANLFGVHKNSVRNWVKGGLPTSDDRRPMLILGRDLVAFLHARRVKNKRPCQPGEIYCMRCRAAQRPAGDMAEYQAHHQHLGEPDRHLPVLRIHDVPAGQSGQAGAGWRESGHHDAASPATHRREPPALRKQ
jgi:hypothetical protein